MNPLEEYLRDLRDLRRSGSAVPETSYYPALATLLDEVGATLKPKVKCVPHPADTGAGIPKGGLFGSDQLQKRPDLPALASYPIALAARQDRRLSEGAAN